MQLYITNKFKNKRDLQKFLFFLLRFSPPSYAGGKDEMKRANHHPNSPTIKEL